MKAGLPGPLALDEGFAACRMDGVVPGNRLPAADRAVDINGIDFDQARMSAGLLGSDHGGSASAETVEHDAAPGGAVAHGVRNHLHRLYRRMQRKLFQSIAAGAGHAAVGPHVRAVSPMLAEAKI